MDDQATARERVEVRGPFVSRDIVLPPPQPGVRYVRVPVRAVLVIADDPLRDRVERFFHWPMIVLALCMLPLLAWEFLAPPQWGTWQWWASALALAVIWTAFFVEFVIKIAIAESRIEYVKRNWLDVIILALPLIRPLRIASLARTSQLFTLRGVGMKFLRYAITIVIGLEATDRFLERVGVKVKRGRLDPREMTRHQLTQEVLRLRRLTDRWTEWFALHQGHVERHGTCAPHRTPSPCESPTADDEVLVIIDRSAPEALLPGGLTICGSGLDARDASDHSPRSAPAGHSEAALLDPSGRGDTVNRPG